jgi:hypothetical protein
LMDTLSPVTRLSESIGCTVSGDAAGHLCVAILTAATYWMLAANNLFW